jgi:hypothetical protein
MWVDWRVWCRVRSPRDWTILAYIRQRVQVQSIGCPATSTAEAVAVAEHDHKTKSPQSGWHKASPCIQITLQSRRAARGSQRAGQHGGDRSTLLSTPTRPTERPTHASAVAHQGDEIRRRFGAAIAQTPQSKSRQCVRRYRDCG